MMTMSDIPLKSLYTPEDVKDQNYDRDIADPGQFPYTRGRRLEPTGTHWIHRELSGEGNSKRSNEQIKYLLSKGQQGVDIVVDTPTFAMVDADHPMARHTVGTQGVSLCRKQDYIDLLQGLPLEDLTISASARSEFTIIGFYMATRDLGFDPKKFRGSVIQQPLYGEDCCYAVHMPIDLRLRLSADTVAFCVDKMPRFHALMEDAYYIADGGLNSIEEISLGMLEIRFITRELLRRGVDIDKFAPRIAILVDGHTDVFETIAKIRATRRLYAKMMRDEFGAKDPRSLHINVTAHTSGYSLTAEQPVNNVVRGTIQGLALAMAGVQAMEISTFDEAYRVPTKEAHEVALRTQQIIQYESNVTLVNDPLGGSYFIESLTTEIENRIWKMIQEIEAEGDLTDLSEGGYFRQIFTDTMARCAERVLNGYTNKVGVNMFQTPPEEDTLLRDLVEGKFESDKEQIEAIIQHRATRNHKETIEAIELVVEAAKNPDTNLMYPMIDAFDAGATMGEIAGVLREVYGYTYDRHNAVVSPLAKEVG